MINQKEANKIEDEKMRIDLQNDNAPKICSVCKRIVKPPIEWWDSVNACSECVKKAAKEIQKGQKNKIIKTMEESTNHQENLYDAWKEKGQLGIQIDVAIDGEIIATRNAFDFEGAEENLGKLRRDYEKKQAEEVDRLEDE